MVIERMLWLWWEAYEAFALTEFALHLSRLHQRPNKYFTSTTFFEIIREGYIVMQLQ